MSGVEFDLFQKNVPRIMQKLAKTNTRGKSCHRLLNQVTALCSVPSLTPLLARPSAARVAHSLSRPLSAIKYFIIAPWASECKWCNWQLRVKAAILVVALQIFIHDRPPCRVGWWKPGSGRLPAVCGSLKYAWSHSTQRCISGLISAGRSLTTQPTEATPLLWGTYGRMGSRGGDQRSNHGRAGSRLNSA